MISLSEHAIDYIFNSKLDPGDAIGFLTSLRRGTSKQDWPEFYQWIDDRYQSGAMH